MKVVTDSKYYDEIAKKLRICGASLPKFSPADMADALDEVVGYQHGNGYATGLIDGSDKGRREAYDEFWDAYQNNGEKNNYTYAFANKNWTDATFKPKYDMVASTMYFCFVDNDKLTAVDKKSDGSTLVIDGSSISSSTGFNRAFYGCYNLVCIGTIISNAGAPWDRSFNSDIALEEVRFEGTIGTAFDIHWSTKLSRDSLLSILNVCNKSNAGVTITLPAKCIDGKTVTQTYIANDTELNTALTNATNNGYTIVYS